MHSPVIFYVFLAGMSIPISMHVNKQYQPSEIGPLCTLYMDTTIGAFAALKLRGGRKIETVMELSPTHHYHQ
jgi:hypothetical protein